MKTDLNLHRYVLPSGIIDYFELVDGHFTDIDTHLFLDQQPLPPEGGSNISKRATEHLKLRPRHQRRSSPWRIAR